jgi:ABC-type glycerol-3-phosphate transport system permease component
MPWPIKWGNYSSAVLQLIMPSLRSVFICVASIGAILLLAAFSGYTFARLRFPGKSFLFLIVVMMMTVPSVLKLTPNFILAEWMHLRNTYWGLILFYIGGGLLLAIFLIRSFFESLPEEMFESARIEGAGEYTCVWKLAVPLARPIMITIAILTFLNIYNDLIWPMLMLNSPKLHTLAMALQSFAPKSGAEGAEISRPDLGVMTAGYAFSSIPLLLLFMFGMKHFIAGLTSGAVKS